MSPRLFIALLLSCVTVATGQTLPSEAEQERQSERQRIEGEVADLTSLNLKSIVDAVKLSVEFDMLDARTPLMLSERETRLHIPQLKGISRITLLGPRPPELGGGSFFDFLQQDLTSPSTGQIYTRVSCYAGRVSITRDSEWGDWFQSVQLLQDAPPAPGVELAEPPVRLYVHWMHVEDKVPPIRFKLESPSFTELRLTHIREMDQYVRPILRDLHQERALFAVPDQLAWLALGDFFTPDAQILDKVAALLPRMDADDFQTRQKASEELRAMGYPVLLALRKLPRGRLTPQQQAEIESLMGNAGPLPAAKLQELANDPSFLLDVLFTSDPTLFRLTAERIRKVTGKALVGAESQQGDRDEWLARWRDQILPPTTQPGM